MPRDAPPDPARDQTSRFPEARAVHEAIRARPERYPAGWVEQVRFRERYDLPPFRPPRFADGARVAMAVAAIKDEHNIDVGFAAYTPGEWVVELDGERAFRLPRHRDDAANVVVEMTADEFRKRIEDALRAREG